MGARLSGTVLGLYAVVLVLLVIVLLPRLPKDRIWALYVLVVATLVPLAAYVTTRYSIDDRYLDARTLFLRRRVALEEVCAIEYASLRDLSPIGGFLASWVLRGRMYSPQIGEFAMVFTDARSGLLVTDDRCPFYISPRSREEFARELSRRVRRRTGPLPKDVGNPGG